jgi:hypothetical protein
MASKETAGGKKWRNNDNDIRNVIITYYYIILRKRVYVYLDFIYKNKRLEKSIV